MKKLKGYLKVKKEGLILGIASTESPDRDGEVIKQEGWDLKNFKKNPVILASHNYMDFPIGKATKIKVEDGQLKFSAIFSQATEKAREAYELVKEGILNTFSVGFIPRAYDEQNDKIITKSELLEISLVSVPANPEAIVTAKGMKDNNIAQRLCREWIIDEEIKSEKEVKKEAKKEEPKKKKEVSSEVEKTDKQTEKKETVEDINLKLLQKTTGYLQELCKQAKAKRKVGEKK